MRLLPPFVIITDPGLDPDDVKALLIAAIPHITSGVSCAYKDLPSRAVEVIVIFGPKHSVQI